MEDEKEIEELKKKFMELEVKVSRMRIKQRELESQFIVHRNKHDAHLV